MIKDMDKVDVEWMLPLVGHSRTRGHSLRIRGSKFKTELRRTASPKGCKSVEFATPKCGGCWDSE